MGLSSSEPCDHAGCILTLLHKPPHLYRCAGRYCPGLPWKASNTPHPSSCALDMRSTRCDDVKPDEVRHG